MERFLADYAVSVAFTNEHTADAAALIGELNIAEAGPAEKALPYCNIVFIAGEEMKQKLSGYLEELYRQDPASVGGATPGEDFYF